VTVQRPALERRVLASLDGSRIPVLLGACGTGRTSVLLRLERVLDPAHSQFLDLSAVASTPERCLKAVVEGSRFPVPAGVPRAPETARAAFDALTTLFDKLRTPDGSPVVFLLDEFLDVRTFESFPGLRHVQRELISRLAKSRAGFVLASRFTTRTHRLLRDAPARFEVIHMPGLDTEEVRHLALSLNGDREDWAREVAPVVASLTDARAGYVKPLLETLADMGRTGDPVAALAALLSPDGRLTARCRETYDYRLHRARGFGALKAILGILADEEPLTRTEISLRMNRTPGSTKDYLSWLEDVDMVTCEGKRYAFEDPLLRVYVRLYGRATPPDDEDVTREVSAYARARLPQARTSEPVVDVAMGSASRASGIIEID
jgi:hypothetical protein